MPEGRALLRVEPESLLLSALKPAESGRAVVVRVLNPTDQTVLARIAPGFPFARAEAVRLDETPCAEAPTRDGDALRLPVPPHALRSVRLHLHPAD